MAKTILGVDIGSDSLKLALVNNGQVKKSVVVPIPNNLVKDYRVVSPETMGELIRNTMKENGIRCKDAALVYPNELVYVRSVTMPKMTIEQLIYNLPFEFRDYITEELKDYAYDYAMITTPEEMAKEPDEEESEQSEPPLPGQDDEVDIKNSMELLAAAAPLSLLEESKSVLRKAGLKMRRAAPTVCAYISLIRELEKRGGGAGEYCILDLGFQAVRMYMFNGERHVATRNLETGLSTLDGVIADNYNVDIHLAHTYLLTNYNDCQNSEVCRNAYGNIAVELMRALNFYRFSNPDSQLENIWLCGGGAIIAPLREAIADSLDMKVHQAKELLPGGDRLEASYELVQAIGVTMD
jgi:type IV pilus assembly protein PilM